MSHKSGFVNIIGNPNVGKSTLMNAIVGEKLSIITSKSQTTRHRIMGIVNGEDFQIVYSDTPGLLKPNYKLQEAMLNFALSALEDADILLYVTDIYEKTDKHLEFVKLVQEVNVPVLLLINKIDQSTQDEVDIHYDKWSKILPKAKIFPISALEKFNLESVLNHIKELLPEGDPYFPKDELTDKSMRFFVSEIIREKILTNYKKEVPYSVEVVVEEYRDAGDIVHISAIINVERDSQKGIIIGNKGLALKRVGTQARIDIEKFIDKKVFLKTFVKVDKDWRSKKHNLKKFGYHSG